MYFAIYFTDLTMLYVKVTFTENCKFSLSCLAVLKYEPSSMIIIKLGYRMPRASTRAILTHSVTSRLNYYLKHVPNPSQRVL